MPEIVEMTVTAATVDNWRKLVAGRLVLSMPTSECHAPVGARVEVQINWPDKTS